jgi:hypothetical protein
MTSLLLGLDALAFGLSATSEELDIPSFEFGRHQLTILRPSRDIPAIRLSGLDDTTIELSASGQPGAPPAGPNYLFSIVYGGKVAVLLCHEDAKASCCTRDEGRPFGAAL